MNTRNASLAAHGACALALFAAVYALHRHTLGMWGDLVVDYGRELYIAWQVSGGKTLYKDVANFFGPLSSLCNAWFMSLGGLVGLQTANVALTVVMAFLVYGFSLRYAPRPLAVASGLVFLLFTGLNLCEWPTANYNFISPYSHELMHALLAAFVLVNTINVHSGRPLLNGALTGLLLGAMFLLKSEVFVASAAATAVYLGWVAVRQRLPLSTAGAYCLAMLLAFAGLTAAIAAYYAAKTSLPQAVGDLTFMYRLPLDLPQAMKVFYANKSGLNNLAGSLRETLRALAFTLVLSLAAVAALAVARRAGRGGRVLTMALSAGAALVVAVAFAVLASRAGVAITYLFPSWAALALAGLLVFARPGQEGENPNRLPRFVFFAAFGVFLCSKIFFRPSYYSYGSFLLLPAMLCFLLTCSWLARQAAARFGFQAAFLYAAPLLVVGLAISPKVTLGYAALTTRQAALLPMVAEPVLVDSGRHAVAGAVIGYLKAHAAKEDTLAVVPEGAAFNYLTGMANPTRYINLIPAEWQAFTERSIMEAYRSRRPTWIVLLARDNSLYGYGPFCSYADSFCRFLDENYALVMREGASPHSAGKAFGAEIYRLKGSPADAEMAGVAPPR